MSGDPTVTTPDHDAGGDGPVESGATHARRGAEDAVLPFDHRRLVLGAGAVGLVVVAARTTLRVLRNLPFDPVVASPVVREVLAVGTPVALSLALVTVALVAGRPAARVGLLFAGVFGLLGTFVPAATTPAVVAVAGGGALAVVGGPGRPSTYRDLRRGAVAAGLVGGVAVSLAGTTGLVGGVPRALGSVLALGALAAVGVRAEGDRVALLVGTVAFGTVALAGATAPYVVGSAALVAFAVTGVPYLLVGLAAGGGVAATTAGLRRREYALAVGAGTLVLAGVPVTFPRAMAVLLGATLALAAVETAVPVEGVSA